MTTVVDTEPRCPTPGVSLLSAGWNHPRCVNLVPDHVIFHRLFPVSVDRTIVECDWLYTREVVESGQDVSRSVELFHRVNEQDFAACERTQPAMSSRAYADGGVLVASEHHIGEFHHWLRQRLADCRRTILPLASRELAARLRTGPTPAGQRTASSAPQRCPWPSGTAPRSCVRHTAR